MRSSSFLAVRVPNGRFTSLSSSRTNTFISNIFRFWWRLSYARMHARTRRSIHALTHCCGYYLPMQRVRNNLYKFTSVLCILSRHRKAIIHSETSCDCVGTSQTNFRDSEKCVNDLAHNWGVCFSWSNNFVLLRTHPRILLICSNNNNSIPLNTCIFDETEYFRFCLCSDSVNSRLRYFDFILWSVIMYSHYRCKVMHF